MSTEENKALVRRFVDEAQSRGNLDAVDELLASDFVNHSAVPGLPTDRDGVKQIFTMFRTAYPDLRAVIHDQVAEGDRVVTRKTLHGTHRGELIGIPPTGKKVAIEVIDILRVVSGKITDHWNVVDQLGMLQQLGVVPAPDQPTN